MSPPTRRAPPMEPSRHLCACGHFPGDHVRVVPIPSGGSGGGFRLEMTGPCAVCGSVVCPAFGPSRTPGTRGGPAL
ncbi:MAG: hypothetical protein L3J86_04835 [Thermoplasmata archaeon]|nr:hypothetical protein [Thermoplasmata archaeon]